MSANFRSSTREQWGLRRAIWSKLMVAVRPWFFLSRIQAAAIDTYPPLPPVADGMTVRRATREDLLAAANDYPAELNPEWTQQAMERGDYCVAAFDEGRMIAWAWASFDMAPHGDGLWVQVAPPYNYGYKWYTSPEYRGRGLIRQITSVRDNIGQDQGCTHNVGFVETHNYASLRSSDLLEAKTVGYAGYFRLFGQTLPFRTPGVVPHKFKFIRR